MLPILEGDSMANKLEGDHKQTSTVWLMLPILEGDHKQDINSMANVTNT